MLFKLNLGQKPNTSSHHWLQTIKSFAHSPDTSTITVTRRCLAKILIAILILSCIERLSNDIQEVPDHESNICSYWNYYWNCNHSAQHDDGIMEDSNAGVSPEPVKILSSPIISPPVSHFEFVMNPNQNMQ